MRNNKLNRDGFLHFTYKELFHSGRAIAEKIKNTTNNPYVKANLYRLVVNILDPSREVLGIKIYVNSGYRCPILNELIGGSPTSCHLYGMAADLSCDDIEKLYYHIKDNYVYHECFLETSSKTGKRWVHVSLKPSGNKMLSGLKIV